MHLIRKIAMVSLFFIVVSAVLTFVLALTSDYKYNRLTITGADAYRSDLIEDLSIDDNYFLLTPKVLLNYKINKLEYVNKIEVLRVLPNEVFITVTPNTPDFCDDENLYFSESSVPKSLQVDSMCLNVPKILNYSEFDFEVFMDEYRMLESDIIDNVASVEVSSNFYIITMTDETVIEVYLNDFQKVNNYKEYKIVNQYLDLRPKYS